MKYSAPAKATYYSAPKEVSPVVPLVNNLLRSGPRGTIAPAPLRVVGRGGFGAKGSANKVKRSPKVRFEQIPDPEDDSDFLDNVYQKRALRQVWPDRERTKLFLFKQSMPYTVNRYLRTGKYSAGLSEHFLQARLQKYYFRNRTEGFFDLSYPETWREDIDAFSLTNRHV